MPAAFASASVVASQRVTGHSSSLAGTGECNAPYVERQMP